MSYLQLYKTLPVLVHQTFIDCCLWSGRTFHKVQHCIGEYEQHFYLPAAAFSTHQFQIHDILPLGLLVCFDQVNILRVLIFMMLRIHSVHHTIPRRQVQKLAQQNAARYSCTCTFGVLKKTVLNLLFSACWLISSVTQEIKHISPLATYYQHGQPGSFFPSKLESSHCHPKQHCPLNNITK